MITLYTGSVGSGKSYHATDLGKDWVKNRHVIANFPLKFGKSKRQQQQAERWIFHDELTVEFLIAKSIEKGWYGKESQCLVIIDEAGVIFNSRDWQTAGDHRKNWIKFLSQSRKFGYDFIFVAQSDRMIDKQIRGLVEYEVKHLKANNAFFFQFLSLFRVTLFLYVYRWYQTRLKSNLRMAIYNPAVAKRYDTFRTFNLDELIGYLEKMYEGKVIPANVAAFIAAQRQEIEQRQEERQAEAEQLVREGDPSGEGDRTAARSASRKLFGKKELTKRNKPLQ